MRLLQTNIVNADKECHCLEEVHFVRKRGGKEGAQCNSACKFLLLILREVLYSNVKCKKLNKGTECMISKYMCTVCISRWRQRA